MASMSATPTTISPVQSSTLRRQGIIAVSSVGIFSLICCATLLVSLAFLLWRESRRIAPKPTRALLWSQFGALYLALVFADLTQAIAFTLSYYWLFGNPSAAWTRRACNAQGALLQFGDVGSALCNAVIALHTTYVVVRRRKPNKLFIIAALSTICVASSIFAMIGPLAVQDGRGHFYAFTGYWCWINSKYELERFVFHYLFVFISAIISVLCYCVIFWSIRFRKVPRNMADDTAVKKVDAVARKMLLFPFMYLINIMPIAVARVHTMLGGTLSFHYLLVAGCMFALSGACNILLFAYARRTLSLSPLWRRLSLTNLGASVRSEITLFTNGLSSSTLPRPSAAKVSADHSQSFEIDFDVKLEDDLESKPTRPQPPRSVSFSEQLPTLARLQQEEVLASRRASLSALPWQTRREPVSTARLDDDVP